MGHFGGIYACYLIQKVAQPSSILLMTNDVVDDIDPTGRIFKECNIQKKLQCPSEVQSIFAKFGNSDDFSALPEIIWQIGGIPSLSGDRVEKAKQKIAELRKLLRCM